MDKIEFLKSVLDSGTDYFTKDIFAVNGKLCATDKHILFLTNKPDNFNKELNDFTDKVSRIYTPDGCKFEKYSVSEMKQLFSTIPLVDEIIYEDCEECEGSGEVEYTYESKSWATFELDHDCPKCNGSGNHKHKTGNKEPDYNNSCVVFGENSFNPKYISKIFDCPNCPDVIEIGQGVNKLYFRAGDFEGVCMGMTNIDRETKLYPIPYKTT